MPSLISAAYVDEADLLLVTYNCPYNSNFPIDSEDDSLSFIHTSRIPPPGLAVDYVDYICLRENIHSSRAQLYLSAPRSRSVYASYSARHGTWKTLDDPTLALADANAPVFLSERAGTREHPLVLYLDLDPSMDRVHAAVPIGKLERFGRRVAKVVGRGVTALSSGFLACFGILQKIPKGLED